jgi:hypothetical protein
MPGLARWGGTAARCRGADASAVPGPLSAGRVDGVSHDRTSGELSQVIQRNQGGNAHNGVGPSVGKRLVWTRDG